MSSTRLTTTEVCRLLCGPLIRPLLVKDDEANALMNAFDSLPKGDRKKLLMQIRSPFYSSVQWRFSVADGMFYREATASVGVPVCDMNRDRDEVAWRTGRVPDSEVPSPTPCQVVPVPSPPLIAGAERMTLGPSVAPHVDPPSCPTRQSKFERLVSDREANVRKLAAYDRQYATARFLHHSGHEIQDLQREINSYKELIKRQNIAVDFALKHGYVPGEEGATAAEVRAGRADRPLWRDVLRDGDK